MKVFIGYDDRESAAFWVLAHSIWSRASVPVEICPLKLDQVPTDRRGSTDFSFSRFLVPYLCNYEGHALFVDCDMVCLGDVKELDFCPEGEVAVCKIDYHPEESEKFLGEKQLDYAMKCWSAVMLFNNAKCRHLTPKYVNTAQGLNLHQFTWADRVDGLPLAWQFIPGEPLSSKGEEPKMVHYTEGGPWFEGYENCPMAEVWDEEYRDLMACL